MLLLRLLDAQQITTTDAKGQMNQPDNTKEDFIKRYLVFVAGLALFKSDADSSIPLDIL